MLSSELIEQVGKMDVKEIIQLYSLVESRYDEFKRTDPYFSYKKWQLKNLDRTNELRRENVRAFRARKKASARKEETDKEV
jgi:hypothetical protein